MFCTVQGVVWGVPPGVPAASAFGGLGLVSMMAGSSHLGTNVLFRPFGLWSQVAILARPATGRQASIANVFCKRLYSGGKLGYRGRQTL